MTDRAVLPNQGSMSARKKHRPGKGKCLFVRWTNRRCQLATIDRLLIFDSSGQSEQRQASFDARRRCDPLVWQRTTEAEPRLKRLEADAIRFGAAVRSRRNRWAVWRTITAELRALIGWNGRHPERFTLLDSAYRNLWDRFQGGAA